MSGTKIEINIFDIGKTFFLLWLLLPYVGISNFQYITELSSLAFLYPILNKLMIVNSVILLCYVLYHILLFKRIISKYCILIIGIYCYILMRTLINGGMGYRNLLTVIVLMSFLDIFLFYQRKNIFIFIDALNILLTFNFAFILRFVGQGGLVFWSSRQQRYWNSYYLLGYDNGYIVFMLPLMCFNFILFKQCAKKRYLAASVIDICSELLINSTTSLIALFVFAFLYLMKQNRFLKMLFYKTATIILIYSAGFIFFVIFKVQNILDDVIFYLFHKDLNHTRWVLWNDGIEKAKAGFFFGYGYNKEIFGKGYLTPHNMILEWMIQGGIIEVIGYLVLLCFAFHKLQQEIDSYAAKILWNGIFAVLLAYMSEGYSEYIYYWIFLTLILVGCRYNQFMTILGMKSKSENFNIVKVNEYNSQFT